MTETTTRRTGTTETEAIRKAGLAIAQLWTPQKTIEIHTQLAGLSVAFVSLATGITDYAEYLATRRAHGRLIVNPLINMSVAVASVGGDLAKIDSKFCQLYAGQLAQDEQGQVPPMAFPPAA